MTAARTEQPLPRYAPGEEIANVLSHGVMALAMLAALPFAAVWHWVIIATRSASLQAARWPSPLP